MSNVIRLSDIYCAKQRERTHAQLRAEVLDEEITMKTLVYFFENLSAQEPVNDAVFVGWD